MQCHNQQINAFVSNLALRFKQTVLTRHNSDMQVKLAWLIQDTKKGS